MMLYCVRNYGEKWDCLGGAQCRAWKVRSSNHISFFSKFFSGVVHISHEGNTQDFSGSTCKMIQDLEGSKWLSKRFSGFNIWWHHVSFFFCLSQDLNISPVLWPPPLVLLKMWVVCAYECMTELRIFCQGPINIGARTQAEDVKMTQVFTYFQRKSSDLLIRVKGAKRPPRGGLQLWFKVSVVYVLTPLWKEGKKSRDNRVVLLVLCLLGNGCPLNAGFFQEFFPTDFDRERPPKE